MKASEDQDALTIRAVRATDVPQVIALDQRITGEVLPVGGQRQH